MTFQATQTHPGQTPATEYTLTLADGRVLVMVANSSTPDKVHYAGSTRYQSRAAFDAGCEKIKAAGGSVVARQGFEFA